MGPLDFQILEHALFAQGDVLGAVVGLSSRVGVDEVVAEQFFEGVEIAVDHRLKALIFKSFDLGLDRVAHAVSVSSVGSARRPVGNSFARVKASTGGRFTRSPRRRGRAGWAEQ